MSTTLRFIKIHQYCIRRIMETRECFGELEEVFPMGSEGLREVVPECFQCSRRVECLRQALRTEEGIALRLDALERDLPQGFKGRFRRWSEKKALSRQGRNRKKKKE